MAPSHTLRPRRLLAATGCITVSGPVPPRRPRPLVAVYEINFLTSIAGSAPVYNQRVVAPLTPRITGPSTYDAPMPLPGNLCMKDRNGRQLKVGIITKYNDGTTEYHSVPITGGSTCRALAYIDG